MKCQYYLANVTQCKHNAQDGKEFCEGHKDCQNPGRLFCVGDENLVMLSVILGYYMHLHVPVSDLIICTESEAQYISNFIKAHPDYIYLLCPWKQIDAYENKWEHITVSYSKPIKDLETASFYVKKTLSELLALLASEGFLPENGGEAEFLDIVMDICDRPYNKRSDLTWML